MHNMHVTFMFTGGGVNNLIKGGENVSKLMWVGIILPVLVIILYLDNRYAGKEIFTTGQTGELYMYTQKM